jgi:hypothetical protein
MFWCWTELPLYRDHPIFRERVPCGTDFIRPVLWVSQIGNGGVSETGWVGAVAIRGLAVGTIASRGTRALKRSGPLEWLSPQERRWTQEPKEDFLQSGNFYAFKVR